MKKIAKRLLLLLTASLLLAITGVGATVYWLVEHPGAALQPENIQKILAIESPVFYRDGRERIGVFFQQQHRQYVPFDRIPQDFINAIVAAEDQSFFRHHGVDFKGILRAMLANIKAGRVVAGGSTISQQTAKNLFKRKDRSLRSKLQELIHAWQLERHFGKEKILEFYSNQFFVSGNGRGLGVAARYYFDKPVEQLDTLECAFIAGSVKRPNAYNPFTKKTEQESLAARRRARVRTGYVLDRMLELGMLDTARHRALQQRQIPFSRGRMSFALNSIMDQVKQALEDPQVEEALSQHGIDNIATSGIRVVTTIDKAVQQGAESALRRELSRLDIRLTGYQRNLVQTAYGRVQKKATAAAVGRYVFGRIMAIEGEGRETRITVDLGRRRNQTVTGVIDGKGMMRALRALVRHNRNRWSEADYTDLPLLREQLAIGDLVYVYVRSQDRKSGLLRLDLEKYPQLQGAALVLQQGEIRAMVGGMENYFFNRAMNARRTMGSVFKPLLFAAALQLGWSNDDLLENDRDVFVLHNQPYFPRPDHHSPFKQVSMSWAGVTSENVASVWLLYHLCDKLTPAQFKEVAQKVGMGRGEGESYLHFMEKIRDQFGVVVTREKLRQAAFRKAVSLVAADLLFDGEMAAFETLKGLHYALDQTMVAEASGAEADSAAKSAEISLRHRLVRRNFVGLEAGVAALERLREQVTQDAFLVPPGLYILPAAAAAGRQQVAYFSDPPEDGGWQPVSWFSLRDILSEQQEAAVAAFWDNILIEGLLPAGLVRTLTTTTETELAKLQALRPYDESLLAQLDDYRVMVGLQYVIGLCRALGIESALEPVLSFPLGSNVITPFEAARAYEGLMHGRVTVPTRGNSANGQYLLDRIENSDGEVIYQSRRIARPVLQPRVSVAVSDILRNVVRYGTGKRANREILLHSHDPEKEQYLRELRLRVPAFGKTGTADRYTNASFVGFLPNPDGHGAVTADDGYVLAAYVGYDDNAPMRHRDTHITGSVGALPVWIEMAKTIVLSQDYAAAVDVVDYSFTGKSVLHFVEPDLGQVRLAVAPDQGGRSSGRLVQDPEAEPAVLVYGRLDGQDFMPTRMFQPFWQSRSSYQAE